MPLEIRDVADGVGVVITGKGMLAEKEWLDCFIEHLTQDRNKFRKYRYSLSDYTAVTETDISSDAILTIAEYCRRAAKINPKPIVATVANQDLTFGLSRMWEILVDRVAWETMVFRNREDAEAWITEMVKEKFGMDNPIFS